MPLPLPSTMTKDYSPEIEEKGNHLQTWIENDRAAGCPYAVSPFTLSKPRHPDYAIKRTPTRLDASALVAIGLDPSSQNSGYHKVIITKRDEGPPTWWIGRTGPGVIFLDDIFRSTRSEDPYISEFTKAVYKLNFPLNSLAHVVVTNVNESKTLSCVKSVYKFREGALYPSSEKQIWEPSSTEYKLLLGAGIGKVVAAFVLSSWGQGRKCIARIVTFHLNSDVHKLYLRFDIEDI